MDRAQYRKLMRLKNTLSSSGYIARTERDQCLSLNLPEDIVTVLQAPCRELIDIGASTRKRVLEILSSYMDAQEELIPDDIDRCFTLDGEVQLWLRVELAQHQWLSIGETITIVGSEDNFFEAHPKLQGLDIFKFRREPILIIQD